MAAPASTWSPSSWRALPAAQQPEWPDPEHAREMRERLLGLPPLVFAGEARNLQAALAEVAAGRGFLLQAGDCAESFDDFSAVSIREKLKIMLQMAAVLTYGAMLPVVKVGRIAGQFVKPRSSPVEVVDGLELPSFRGHMVHDDAPTLEARTPDPERMVQGYHQSAATLNLLRAFTKGGFADLTKVHLWNQEFVASSPEGRRYESIASEIERALAFMAACGIDLVRERRLHEVDVWTSHEGLLLDYEESLTRRDSLTGRWYDCSAHMLWVGERTRAADGAHAEFFAGVGNPLGCKLGPSANVAEVLDLCERLDPDRTPGRLTLICRMGAGRVTDVLPPLVQAVTDAGHPVVWACDPMHANAFRTHSGLQDAPVRGHHGRARRVLRDLPRVRRVAGRRAPRVHRRGRDRVPGRGRGRARGPAERPLPHPVRPAPERAPVARSGLPAGRADAVGGAAGGGRDLMRVAVVGLGLIGGSVGLAAAARGDEVVAFDPDPDAARAGLERGAAAHAADSLEAAVADAEIAVICGPVARLPELVARTLDATPEGCAVSDVGSTKGRLMAAAGGNGRFVGGHPVCGSEARGVQNARADLFAGATWFLTPVAATDAGCHRRLHAFVAALGARPVAIDPDAHDRLVALTSHLPHALANLLMNQAGSGRVDGHDPLAAVGGSFRDMTRVAGANARIWVDIFLDNRDALLDGLREHTRRIDELTRALERDDAGFVARWVAEAAGNRRRLLQAAYPAVPEDLYRVRVHVPDRPGVLSGITQALGAEGINIEDFELHHMSTDAGGTAVVLVAGEQQALRAVELLDAQGYSAAATAAVEP